MNLALLASWLPTIARFIPQLQPIVGIVQAGEPVLEKAIPILIQEWPAIQALGVKLSPIAQSAIGLVGKQVASGVSEAEAIASTAAKLAVLHKMTPEQEQAWFDRASSVSSGGM